MSIESHGHEHEFEPQMGLPEKLPRNERLLWQGQPDVRMVALRVFHLRKLALYFGGLIALRAAFQWSDGVPLGDMLAALGWPLALSAMCLGAMGALAWATARTAVYTITDKRVVMRVGIVLTLTFNLPLRCIAAASLARLAGGHGDISLALEGSDRIAWFHLWPHVRPWQLRRPEPMLRAVPEAEYVAGLLVQAWSAARGVNGLQPLRQAEGTPAQAASGDARPQLQPSLS